MNMSPAVVTHSRLLDAGVESQLIVGEGMGHCYIYQSELPEAQAAYRAIASFFRPHLKEARAARRAPPTFLKGEKST